MNTATIILSSLLTMICAEASAQVYDQAALIERMPRIPATVTGVGDEEKERFRMQVYAAETYLDSLMQHYKHPTRPLGNASQKEMFEFNQIWEELYQQHDNYLNASRSASLEQMGALSQEEFDRQAELSEELRKVRKQSVKTMKDTSDDENRIDRAMYDNHAHYNERRAEILTNDINHYLSLIQNMATKTKRADTLFLPEIPPNAKYPCAAIFNAQQLLALLKGYLEFFVPPYTPKFE